MKVGAMEYKPSHYNLFFEIDDNKWLLYNTLSGCIVEIDNETKYIIENIDKKIYGSETPRDMLKKFLETNVILPKDIDELDVIRVGRKFSFLNKIGNIMSFTLIMTYSCNLKCIYCYEGNLKRKNKYLTRNDIDVIFDKFLSKFLKIRQYPPTLSVNLYGGEPLLNWDGCKYVFKKLDSLKRHELIKTYVLGMVTNGTLLDDEKIEVIRKYKCGLQITLDGSKKVHDRRRKSLNGTSTFDVIIKNLKKLSNYRQYVGLRINVDSSNVDSISQLLGYLKKNEIVFPISFGVIRPGIVGFSDPKGIVISEKDLPNILYHLYLSAREHDLPVERSHVLQHGRSMHCSHENPNAYIIDPYLDVYSCWVMIGIEKYRIGKITKKGEFTPTSFYYKARGRDALEFEECKNCKLLPICMGGCAFASILKHGTPNAPGCIIHPYCKAGLRFYRELRQDRQDIYLNLQKYIGNR